MFDGGDCRAQGAKEWPNCPHNTSFIGDGVCDHHLRNANCSYDKTDCLENSGIINLKSWKE